MKHAKGFTLIELLIVIAIIALVGTLAAVAVNSARSKQRDATRLANVRQMQSALEDYFNARNMYPGGVSLPLGSASGTVCLSTGGFGSDCSGQGGVIMRTIVPTLQKGLDGHVTCGTPPRSAFCYSQQQEGASYGISFELENALPAVELTRGANCAMPTGMRAGACE